MPLTWKEMHSGAYPMPITGVPLNTIPPMHGGRTLPMAARSVMQNTPPAGLVALGNN